MKRNIIVLLIIIMSALSFAIPSYAEEATSSYNSQPYVLIENMIASIAFEKEHYGFNDNNIYELCVASEIPVYETIDNKFEPIYDMNYYPILDGSGTLVSMAVVFNGTGGTNVSLSSELVSHINAYLGSNPNSQSISLIFDNSAAYIYNGNVAMYIYDMQSDLISSRTRLSDIPDEAYSNITTSPIQSVYQIDATAFVSTCGQGDDWAIISPPLIYQGNTSWCWAGCMASMVNYELGRSYTCQEVANIFTNSTAQGATVADVKSRFGNTFGLYYTRVNATTNNEIYLTPILSSIGSDNPIYGHFEYEVNNEVEHAHAMVIRGIDYSSQHTSGSTTYDGKFYVMDPAQGVYRVSGFNYNGNYGTFEIPHVSDGYLFVLDSYLYI